MRNISTAGDEVKPPLTIDQAFDKALDLHQGGQLRLAEGLYRQILSLRPDHAAAACNLGALLVDRQEYADGLAFYDQCLRSDPGNAGGHFNRGRLMMLTGHHDLAAQSLLRAMELQPTNPHPVSLLSNVYRLAGRTQDAVEFGQRAVRLAPTSGPALTNYGLALLQAQHFAQALAQLQLAVQLNASSSENHVNLALALEKLGRLAEARRAFEQAILLDSDNADAHFGHAQLLLLQGDYLPGWKEYEWRWRRPTHARTGPPRHFPEWDGADSSSCRIFLYCEQGFGDVVQMARYIPLLAKRGFEIVLQLPPSLAPLLLTVEGISQTVPLGVPPPPCDFQASLLTLPRLFGTRVETIPAPTPYLHPVAERVQRWRPRIDHSALAVGLAWQGRPTHPNDVNRSMTVDDLKPLAGVEGCRFFVLSRENEAAIPAWPNIDTIGLEFTDFGDTAAVASLMDVVVTVDTSICHVAGALGLPTWLLLPFAPDFRWLTDRCDSPWYPSLRLFRQDSPGSWQGPVDRVRQALGAMAKTKKPLVARTQYNTPATHSSSRD